MEISGDSTKHNGWSKSRILVSVVVPNHGRDIKTLVESIKASSYKHTEVLIIDRGKERALQRNMGILEAHGNAILWLDSDQSVSACLIKECVGLLNQGYSAIYIPEVLVAKSFFGKIRKFEREFYTGTAIDCVRFVSKSACPLFDETLNGPEDSDFDRRVPGYRAISKNVLYHHDDIGVWEYCRKKAYYTKSMKRFAEKWPNDKCLNIWWRCFWVFVEQGKWKKLLRHPILSLGIFFIIITRGVIYYAKR